MKILLVNILGRERMTSFSNRQPSMTSAILVSSGVPLTSIRFFI